MFHTQFDKIIDHLKEELTKLRTNRATPLLIEHIEAKAYEGNETLQLMQLASITVPEARQLLVEPWDQATIKAIEKALQESDLGFSIVNEGTSLRLTIPLMTDKIKQQIIKLLNQKLEDARIVLRNNREKAKEEITKQEKNKEISKDEKFKLLEDLDKSVKEYNEQIKEIGDKKEKEINS